MTHSAKKLKFIKRQNKGNQLTFTFMGWVSNISWRAGTAETSRNVPAESIPSTWTACTFISIYTACGIWVTTKASWAFTPVPTRDIRTDGSSPTRMLVLTFILVNTLGWKKNHTYNEYCENNVKIEQNSSFNLQL